ncbi:MAG: NADAR family protein [Clostridia bacterium]|nr:NADAR family protein [Clostridia bacterium]
MKYTRESIIKRYNAGEPLNIIAFWGHTPHPKKMTKACFSQWYDCSFELQGERYHTSEQYMMAQKAALFGDMETKARIMAADHPKDYKALGREVKNFDAALWDREKYSIVLRGNLAKFSQNPELGAFLLSTGNSVLVEGSPYDHIWGVRLGIDDPRIQNPNEWLGQNLLGFVLMETRDELRTGFSSSSHIAGPAEE